MSNMLLWSSLLLAVAPQAWGQANSLPSQPHLLVKGQAQREVVPDQFGINVTLRSIDKDPAAARDRAQANAVQILAAFKAQHALRDSVQASALSIAPEYKYENNARVFSGTKVERSLSAQFTSLDEVRRLLGNLKTSEELQVSGITTSYKDEAAVRAELKRQAAQQTRDTAQKLADSYGVRLGGLYTISEVAPNFAYGVQAGTWPGSHGSGGLPGPPAPPTDIQANARAADGLAESLEAGSITLSENVYAIFLIAQ
ncbi:SIMPL domain-containing protein [Stenotrophomonas terrae]|uniref:SIMPL domain-containing protein n=1 Tax=Stenotrophomonas terrae TaxID=405446 RepID=UPI003D36BD73